MELEQSEPHYQKAEGSTLPFVNLGFNMQTPTVTPSSTHTMAQAAGKALANTDTCIHVIAERSPALMSPTIVGPSPGLRGFSSPTFTLSSPLVLSDSGGKASVSRQPAAPTSQASRPSTLPSRSVTPMSMRCCWRQIRVADVLLIGLRCHSVQASFSSLRFRMEAHIYPHHWRRRPWKYRRHSLEFLQRAGQYCRVSRAVAT